MPTRLPSPVARLSRRGLLALGAAAAVMPKAARADTSLEVVATTGMLADTLREIGGDAVAVTGLMGPGVDPHAYRQTRTDILAMSRADLIVANGLYLEAQLEGLLADFAARKPVHMAAEAVPVEARFAHADYDGRFDPHVWMDPALWSLVADGLAETLAGMRPDVAEDIAARSADFTARLAALDDYAGRVLGSVPDTARVLLTAHDAFAYFGAAYGWEVTGIQGISTESEAGLARISELVDMLVERRIGAVFVESSVSDRNIRALVEGAAAKGHAVKVGGELFSDAMGAPGSYEGTYIGMIDHNVTTIAAALGGEAPSRGLNGRLAAAS